MKKLNLAQAIFVLALYGLLTQRIGDFVDEAVCRDFHMSRLGLHLTGSLAGLIQFGLILLCFAGLVRCLRGMGNRHALFPPRP